MHRDTGRGVEDEQDWDDGLEKLPPKVELDGRGWPILHANEPCDGTNPTTGRQCVIGYHQGYHRDAAGAEWLDE